MSDGAERPFVAEPPGAVDDVVTAATTAAQHWGLPAPQLLRLGMNGTFAAGDDVVLRVSRPSVPAGQALWLAGELARHGVRVPAPARDDVVVHGGLSVVAVERIHPAGAVDWAEVGAMVARVHALDPATVTGRHPLPWCGSFPWWDFDALLADVGPAIDAVALAALRASVERCYPLIAATRDDTGVVCHGDVHPGNVLPTADGSVLLDWDLLCRGPIAWDHGPLMTWTERWGGEPGIYERFADGYGESLRGDPLGEAVAELRLVAATLMRVRAGRADPLGAVEAERRLRWWRGDPGAPTWAAQ
ncbi:MAG: phosphotransferase [Ilumatobacteraceae bacterium]